MSDTNTQQNPSPNPPHNKEAENANQNPTDKPLKPIQPKKNVQKYIGLPNQGATCYMNSLLQTLFMTPEFRSALYSWKYDEKQDAKPEDCIPLQLQQLFASLQLKHSAWVTTKPLTKSFQWEESTSFEQHDIQEFSSVLFDAIDQSMKSAQSDTFLNDLYEGTSVSYVKCLECGYESSRPENFLNIGLTVKNDFDQIYNDNLRRAIQLYLKPEKLEGPNQYFCEVCNKKVDATRGTKFVKVPKLLNVIVNRFSFDFIYMRRVKLDDFFEFPFILNMNDYINGYENIKDKVGESSTPEFFNEYKRQKEAERAAVRAKNQAAKQSDDPLAEKKPIRSEVRSYISDLKKRGEQNKQNSIDVVIYTKDLDGGNANAANPEQEDDSNKDIKMNIRNAPDTVEESKADVEAVKVKEDRDIKRAEERKKLINEYLNDGPLVYELYSILVHSGGAYGGHYYAYIKSFEDGKWYNFNDTTVSEFDPNEIPDKTFGGGKSANAYMLIYRQVESAEEEKITVGDDAIPQYLKKFIDEEAIKQQEIENQRLEKAKHLNLRIFHGAEVKYLPAHADEAFKDFELRALNLFDFPEKTKNVRLRLYQPLTESMQETYDGREDQTLTELRIYASKCFKIETKKDEEEFEEFKADSKCFRIALWRENIPNLAEENLRPQKVLVHKDGVVKDLVEAISKKFDIPAEHVRLIKKVQVGGFPTAMIVNAPENMGLRYNEAKIFEGLVLFAERAEIPEAPVLWKEEFDKDAYNYKIKFNSPYTESSDMEYNNFVMIDARKSLLDLKAEICKNLNINEEEVILRKGGRAGTEIKDMRQTVLSANFINGSSVFVEFGKPAISGELRILASLALENDDHENDLVTHEFEDLGEFIISGDNTAQEVKEQIAEHVKKHKGLEWDTKKMRLRERVANRLIRVYRNVSLQNQGVCDKKQISIELLENPESLAPKENVVNCRIWNSETLELGPQFEVIVDRSKSLKSFAQKIFQQNQTVEVENMMGIKIPPGWEFIKYELLFQDWVYFNDDEKMVYNDPLYLNVDGAHIFIKDKNLNDKELTEEEKKNIGISRIRKVDRKEEKAVEKSLKIHVKKKEADNTGENVESNQSAQESGSTQSNI